MFHHVRYAFRMLRREWAFSLMAMLTLALGIGAATGLFSVMRHLLWSELPYAQPDRLAFVWAVNQTASDMSGITELPSTWMDLTVYEEQSKTIESIALLQGRSPVLSDGSQLGSEKLSAARVSGRFFEVLGVQPFRGRFFSMEEDAPGKEKVVVLSYRLWQRRFEGSEEILGKKITLDNQPFTIIGVAGPAMTFPSGNDLPAPYGFGTKTDLWMPTGLSKEERRSTDSRSFPLIARLKPNVDPQEASAEVKVLAENTDREFGGNNVGWSARVVPLKQQTASRARSVLWILAASIGCLLLIAAANFSQLLLARTTRRTHELGIRAALGAGRARLVANLLTENLVLAFGGGILGAAGAALTLRVLVLKASDTVPYLADLRADFSLAGFAIAVAALLGVLFGLLPAFTGISQRLAETLKQSSRTVAGGSAKGRAVLIVSQLALATVLLAVNLLLIRSLWNVVSLDTGFDKQSIASVKITLDNRYPESQDAIRYQRRAMEEIAQVPGVESVGIINALPLSGEENLNLAWPEGTKPRPEELPFSDDRRVMGNYFETMGIRLIEGRDFRDTDTRGAEQVTIVNQAFQERFFPGQSAIGRRIIISDGQPYRIIGVVENVRQGSLEAPPRLQFYRSALQYGTDDFGIVARLRDDGEATRRSFREAVRALDPTQFVSPVTTMQAYVDRALSMRTFWTALLGVFAALAVFITLAGLHASISYHATMRMPEFGVRAALGATRVNLARLVLRQGLLYASVGLALGVAAALLVRPVLSSQIYGVSATDPGSLAGAALGVLIIALIASAVPALRAAKSDPSSVLRAE